VAQRKPRSEMDREAFLASVKLHLGNGAANYPEAVAKATAREALDPELESEALMTGLVEIAREVWGTNYRHQIVRTRPVSVTRTPGNSETVTRQVSVTRSAARDWPVFTGSGHKPLEACTVEEAESAILHLSQTIDGIVKNRAVVEAAVKAARNAGVALIGELPDDVLDACLEEGQ